MKKTLKIAALAALAALTFAACGDGYQTTESGLKYKFISQNQEGQQVSNGDLIKGKYVVIFNDSILDSVKGDPVILFMTDTTMRGNYFERLLTDGFMMLHEGDEVEFVFNADSLQTIGMRMPATFKAGEKQTLKYKIKVSELMNETIEQEKIKNYLTENKLDVQPTEDGIYILSVEHGNGPKVEDGKTIKVNYTGRFLNGKIFDSSDSTQAPQAHEPIEYVVGQQPMIPGWEKAMAQMEQGGKARVLIPSNMAYGKKGSMMMEPYSTLLFDFEVLSVKETKAEKK